MDGQDKGRIGPPTPVHTLRAPAARKALAPHKKGAALDRALLAEHPGRFKFDDRDWDPRRVVGVECGRAPPC